MWREMNDQVSSRLKRRSFFTSNYLKRSSIIFLLFSIPLLLLILGIESVFVFRSVPSDFLKLNSTPVRQIIHFHWWFYIPQNMTFLS